MRRTYILLAAIAVAALGTRTLIRVVRQHKQAELEKHAHAPAPPHAAAGGSDGGADPRCVRAAAREAARMRACVPEATNRVVGMRFELSQSCALLNETAWGQPDEAIWSCFAGKFAETSAETSAASPPPRPAGPTAWFVDFPLSDPPFIPGERGEVHMQTLNAGDGDEDDDHGSVLLEHDWWALCPRGDTVTEVIRAFPGSLRRRKLPRGKMPVSRCPDQDAVLIDGLELIRPLPDPDVRASGTIPRVTLAERALIDADQAALAVGARSYHLRTRNMLDYDNPRDHLLMLESGRLTQVLLTGIDDVRVLWAGDLDGDGRLDLAVSSTVETAPRYDLFVSPGAADRLVRHVATLQLSGD